MCTPSIPQDTSADQAAAQTAQRQAQITQGQGNIDSAFQQFTPDYYNKYQTAYEDNYNPQVDEQYGIAKQKDEYNAARTGTLNSTPAIHAQDLLNESYGDQRQQVAGNAIDATNTLKNNVAGQKSQLYALNSSSADPTLAASNAAAAAGTLSSQPQYSALGDLFGSLVNGGAAYLSGQNAVNPYLKAAGGVSTTTGAPIGSSGGVVG